MHTAAVLLLLPVFGEKTERLLQDLVGPLELAVLFFQLVNPLLLRIRRHALVSAADVCLGAETLSLPPPIRQRVIRHAELLRRLLYANLVGQAHRFFLETLLVSYSTHSPLFFILSYLWVFGLYENDSTPDFRVRV